MSFTLTASDYRPVSYTLTVAGGHDYYEPPRLPHTWNAPDKGQPSPRRKNRRRRQIAARSRARNRRRKAA